MSLLQFIASSNFIVLNKILIKEIGIEETLLLGELASELDYWQKRDELVDGFFYSTIENVEENTTLTAYKQRRSLKTLQDKGLIDVKLKGVPAKRYIKIFEEQVIKILNIQLLKNLTSRNEKIKNLDIKEFNTNNNIINNNIINKNNNNNIIKESKKEKYQSILDIYNLYCTNLPKAEKLTDKRKVSINKFLKEFSEDDFKQICINANNSSWLIGNNSSNWKANFDFLMRIDKATKLLENGYMQKTSGNIFIDIGKAEGIL